MGKQPYVVAALDEDGERGINFVKYLYGSKGNFDGFIQFSFSDYFDNCDTRDGDEVFCRQYDIEESTDSVDWQKIMFDMIKNKDNDEKYFTRYYFKRDSLDRIIKVYDPIFSIPLLQTLTIILCMRCVSRRILGKIPQTWNIPRLI